jgi:hypothetical protein
MMTLKTDNRDNANSYNGIQVSLLGDLIDDDFENR